MNSTNRPDVSASFPGSLTPPPVIAPLWRRLAAMLYDSILVIAIWIVVGGIVLAIFGVDETRAQNGIMTELSLAHQLTLFIALLLSPLLFFGFFWTHSGQTLGMQAWRIRVTSEDGGPVTWRQALLRFFAAWLSALPAGLGYFWVWVDPERRAWHDRLSGTRTVRVRTEAR